MNLALQCDDFLFCLSKYGNFCKRKPFEQFAYDLLSPKIHQRKRKALVHKTK
jgi:hypothetical protein